MQQNKYTNTDKYEIKQIELVNGHISSGTESAPALVLFSIANTNTCNCNFHVIFIQNIYFRLKKTSGY